MLLIVDDCLTWLLLELLGQIESGKILFSTIKRGKLGIKFDVPEQYNRF